MTNDNKTTLILTVVVGLLALVAIIISAVSMARNQSPTVTVQSGGGSTNGASGGQTGQQTIVVQTRPGGSSNSGGAMATAGHIYTLAIGHDYGSHEYFDQAGYLAGFGIGMIDLVCSEAKIDCRIMWDKYVNCWDSEPGQRASGGKGLLGGWYDGCTGWYQTVARTHVYQFSQPYLKAPVTYFYVLSSKSFDTKKENIQRSKIVFLDGWASDEKCLARTSGAMLPKAQINYATTTDQAIAMLQSSSNWVALFTTDTTVRAKVDANILTRIATPYTCMLDGNSIMTRKDNDLPVQWNRGYMKIKNNGQFKKYCTGANKLHSDKGSVECL